MSKILLILPVVENELALLEKNINYHLNLFLENKLEYSFFIIIQCKKMIPQENIPTVLSDSHIFLKYTNVFSLSIARNYGIDYFNEHNQFTHLSFMDVRIRWDCVMVQECIKLMNLNLLFWMGKIGWVKNSGYFFQNTKKGLLTKCVTGFVWNIVFHRNCPIPYFNINACISNNLSQELQAGEDCLFCYTLLRRLRKYEIPVCEGTVFHPSRKGEEKRKRYSKAQGAIFRYLLSRLFKLNLWYGFYVLYFFGLFIVNSIFRILLFRPNACSIFCERIKGFCLYKYQETICQGFKR